MMSARDEASFHCICAKACFHLPEGHRLGLVLPLDYPR